MGNVRWRGVALSIALIIVVVLLLGRVVVERRSASRAPPVGTGSAAASELSKDDAVTPAAGRVTTGAREHTREAVRVEVVDAATGQPIPGATVEARDGIDLVDSGATDSLGFASLTVDRSEGVPLLAYRRGFVPADYWLYEDDPAPLIPLRPGLPVAGRVTHFDTGEGAARAEVDVEYVLNGHLPLRPDAQGRFEIPGLPVGETATIRAREEGYWPEEIGFTAEPANTSLEIVLGRGGVCEGRVVDEMARPVAGASIRIGWWNPWSGLETRSDAEGRFTARGLPDSNEHRVVVHTADHRCGLSEPFQCSPDDPVHRCEIVVRPHAYVIVTLTFPDGSPVAEAAVALSARESDWSDQRWCAPAAGTPGVFESGPVEPGEPQLRVTVIGWSFQTRKVRVLPGVRNDVAFRLEEKLGLEGVVVDRDGRPLRGIRVDLDEPHTGPDDRVGIAHTFTDPDGRFRLRGLEASGGTLAFADYDSEARYATLSMDATPGQPPVRAVLDGRPRVVGRLDPVPELLKTSIGCGGEWTCRDIQVRRDGRFEVQYVPAGREFWLRLEVEDLVPWIFPGLKLAADETLDLGILRPLEGVTLKGVVTDRSGTPIANAEVVADAAIEDLNVSGGACTDADGRFAIPRLADVPIEVRAEAQGYAPRKLRILRPGGTSLLTILLEPGGVLEIRDAGDEPVEVESLDGGERVTVSAEYGSADLTLVPGRYRIGEETFEIRAGETTRVDLADGCGEEREEDLRR